MKLLASAAAVALLASAALVRSDPQALRDPSPAHESVWTPEFPQQLPFPAAADKKFTTIPLFGNLNAPKFFNFYGKVSLGTPPQHFKLRIETSDFMVSIPNFKSPTSKHTIYNHNASSTYETNGTGAMWIDPEYGYFGFLSRDTIRFGDIALPNVTFVEATFVNASDDFANLEVDGVFGLAPCPISSRTSLFQQLLDANVISDPVFAFYFSKSEQSEDIRDGEPTSVGEVTIGAIDERRYTGSIHYVDSQIYATWVVKLDAIVVRGNSEKIAIAESGSSILEVVIQPEYPWIVGPLADIEKLALAVGATEAGAISCSSKGPDIDIYIGGVEYKLTKSEYTRRVDAENCRWVFKGIEKYGVWVLGQPFLQKFYSVFEFNSERVPLRVGFALAA